ncbi:MAG: tripartite tricarboxylate transporter substrate binding protein [Reyranella sp.]|jgi:tripartite-type tricarboxylate transporter receptor subunit TctC|nr:tripartite tricarboxylate transporter substrate binding protein [Reyranella sp.]
MLRRHFAALSLAALAPLPAAAQGKVARIVVGFPPGQGIDLVSRIVADALKEELGETFIVENKPGQGGSIALGQVARATPDGSTVLISAMAALVMAPHLYKNVTYDTLKSFEPVGRVGDLPLALVVNPSLPVRTLPELIAYAKANPDKLSHSSSGNSTVSHVAMEELKRTAGIKILHVPYQGSAPAMNDLIAGNVQVALDTVAVTRPHVEAGRLRLIAVGSLERLPFFPDTPTIAEQGFPGFEANAWLGMLLPTGTPRETVDRLATALQKIVRSKPVQDKFLAVGTLPKPSTTADFDKFLKAEYARWGKAIAESGIKAD